MRNIAILALTLVASAFLPIPPAGAQEVFSEFHMDHLWFRFHPEGLGGNRPSTVGSGLEVFAENVMITDFDVIDLRNCIDGQDSPDCSVGSLSQFTNADQDGVAEANEVEIFAQLAPLQMDSLETVQLLSTLLQENVTVDGLRGGDPEVAELVLRGAEGPINSTTPAYADVTIEVDYENDKAADRHEIHVEGLDLDAIGFLYTTVHWTLESAEAWEYRADETQPEAGKSKVTATGWVSDQEAFESATTDTLRLVVEPPRASGGGGSSGMLWIIWVLLGLGLAAVIAIVIIKRGK